MFYCKVKTYQTYRTSIENDAAAIRFTPATLPEYDELAKLAISVRPECIGMIRQTPELALQSVSADGTLIQYINSDLQTEEIVQAALKQNKKAKKYVK